MHNRNRPVPVHEQQNDEELLLSIGQGNRRAFERLAERHTPRMVRLAWRYSGQLASAEDAVQEALVRIWLRAGQWDSSRGSAKSWMDRIVVNLCIDQGRRMVQTVDMDVLEDRIDSAPNPHDQLFGRQLDRAIREAIDALPERQRAALSLCFAKETDCAQGALILGVSVPTMESLLLRGRRSLRKRLAELGFLPKL